MHKTIISTPRKCIRPSRRHPGDPSPDALLAPQPCLGVQRLSNWWACTPPSFGRYLSARMRSTNSRSRNVSSQQEVSVSCWRSLQVDCRQRVCCWKRVEERHTTKSSLERLTGPQPRRRFRLGDPCQQAGGSFSDPRIRRHVLPGRRLRCL